MAADIVQSLFGVSPEAYQQKQADLAGQRALDMAQLDPFQRASYNIGRGAYQLAGGLAGALGGQDPQLQKISQRQALLGMIDPTNLDSYAQAIQAALQSGDTEAAYALRGEMMNARQRAQETEQTKMQYEDYLTKRGLGMQSAGLTNIANELIGQLQNANGSINQAVLSRLQGFQQGRDLLKTLVPETITATEGQTIYQKPTYPGQPLKSLITGAAKPIPFTGDESNAALLLYRTNDPVKIFNERGQAGLDAVADKAAAIIASKKPVTNLTVQNKMQTGFGENLTETITSTVKAGRVARQTIGAVDNMQTLLDEGVRTGFGQDTMLQIGKVGQLLNPDFNVKGLAGAEALQSISTNLVLPQVKQLGVNPTDTDLKFINTGSPGLSKTVAGNKLMLAALRLKLEREQDAAAFTNNWLSQNGKLTTTNPTEGYVKYNSDFDKYTQSSPLYAPASNKLREQFNALGGTAPGGRQTPTARDATNRGGLTRP